MQLLLRRALSATAASTGRLRRCFSTAPPCPPWAMILRTELVKSPEPGTSFLQFKPPGGSILFVPEHFIDPLPRLDPDPKGEDGVLRGLVQGTSSDGLLLLMFADAPATPAVVAKLHAARGGESIRPDDIDPDITRFVCNPLSGEMFRLPDIDGTKKAHGWYAQGILTQSERGHGPPDRYAVAELSVDGEGGKRSFVMRRFFSETGEWDKLVGLPFPLPRPRRIYIEHEVLAFDGRLWWVDLTWGAISADPFGDRPELRFVELPRFSVCPVPPVRNKYAPQGMYRRVGVSEGRLRYVEVSQKEPFVLSSYTLDNDGGDGWTLEHQVALSRVFPDAGKQEGTPVISVIDPLNASFICVIIGNHSLAMDMDMGKVLDCVMIKGTGSAALVSPFIKPCVLPPWLELSRIPSAGTLSSNNATVKSKTLADILVRADAN